MTLVARYKNLPFWARLVVCLPIGALAGFAFNLLMDAPHRSGAGFSAAPAVFIILIGLVGVGGAVMGDPPWGIGRRAAVCGALGSIACGLSLLLPGYAPLAWNAVAVFVAFGGLTIASLLLHRPYNRSIDEMVTNVAMKAERLGMRVFFFGVLLYAAAKTLGLNVVFDLWNAVCLLVLLQTYCMIWVSIRTFGVRPLAEPSA